MKYLLLIYGCDGELHGESRQACIEEAARLLRDLDARGQLVSASPLQSTATATSIRVRNGKTIVTDGPFAETREALGGYFLVDVPDLDEALAIAARIPSARHGTIEVRPLEEVPALALR